jgi:hypothetical protein
MSMNSELAVCKVELLKKPGGGEGRARKMGRV